MTDFKSWSSDDLKKKQTELARMSNGIVKQAESGIFSAEEKVKLRDAAAVLQGFKRTVELEKDRKARQEKTRKQGIDAAAHKAAKLLKPLVDALPLPEQILLATCDNVNCGWPFGRYSTIVDDLEQRGLEVVLKRLRCSQSEWIQTASRNMGLDEHSAYRPVPVSAESAQDRIVKGMGGGGLYEPSNLLGTVLHKIDELRAVAASSNVEPVDFGRKPKLATWD
ncbi:MAG: hypothetical protein V7677_19375 [Motiliproteus sp.]